MRKLTLLIGLAIAVITANGSRPTTYALQGAEPVKKQKFVKEERQNVVAAITPDNLSHTVIRTQPEGAYRLMDRSCHAYFVYQFYFADGNFDGSIVEMVTQSDGTVYLSNPVERAECRHWIKGKKEGDYIYIDAMQPIDDTYADWTYYSADYMAVLDLQIDGDESCAHINATLAEDQQIVLRVDDDGSLVSVDPNLCIGSFYYDYLFESWVWNNVANSNIVISPQNRKVLTGRDTLEYEEWNMICEGSSQPVLVGIDGNSIYVRDMSGYLGDVPFIGTIKGDKVTFVDRQYCGPNYELMRYGYYSTIKAEKVLEDGYDYYTYSIIDNLVFDYDKNARTLTAVDPMTGFCSNFSDDYLYYSELWLNPTIKYGHHIAGVAPGTPTCSKFSDYHDYGISYYYFELDMPNVDKSNAPLDTDSMYLEVTTDGELFKFHPDTYVDLKEETHLLPYGYSDGSMAYANKTFHQLLLPGDDIDEFKFRTVYMHGDEKTYSDYCVYGVNGVEDIQSNLEVETEIYYDLNGLQVKEPGKGIYVKKIVYSDGSSKTVKVKN